MSTEPEPVNPFAAPLAVDSPAPNGSPDVGLTDAEATRTELLGHESSIKAMGCLYGIGGVISLGVGIGLMANVLNGAQQVANLEILCAVYAFVAIVGAASLACAVGLYRLSPAVRPWAIGVQSVSLVLNLIGRNFLGVGLGIYFLWLVSGEKGKRILSDDYREIIAATPHIKRKTSKLLLGLLGVLIFLIVIIAFIAAIAYFNGDM